jgi:hypothetical protein
MIVVLSVRLARKFEALKLSVEGEGGLQGDNPKNVKYNNS